MLEFVGSIALLVILWTGDLSHISLFFCMIGLMILPLISTQLDLIDIVGKWFPSDSPSAEVEEMNVENKEQQLNVNLRTVRKLVRNHSSLSLDGNGPRTTQFCRNGYSVECVEFDQSHKHLDRFSLINNCQIQMKHQNEEYSRDFSHNQNEKVGSKESISELGGDPKYSANGKIQDEKVLDFGPKKITRAIPREVPFPITISNSESKTFNEKMSNWTGESRRLKRKRRLTDDVVSRLSFNLIENFDKIREDFNKISNKHEEKDLDDGQPKIKIQKCETSGDLVPAPSADVSSLLHNRHTAGTEENINENNNGNFVNENYTNCVDLYQTIVEEPSRNVNKVEDSGSSELLTSDKIEKNILENSKLLRSDSTISNSPSISRKRKLSEGENDNRINWQLSEFSYKIKKSKSLTSFGTGTLTS
ncbi:hypothetical protein SNEBB_001411 [Seison nebaliae]|nr:hypothetical protein SNEBB_001411 [Seison nebaliae]